MKNYKPNQNNNQLKICTLSGTNEVGRNCSFLEYNNQIIIVDCGFAFPEQELYGVDYIIPNFNYLKNNKKKILGIVITHGHLDHTGGLQYVLPEVGFPPIYSGRFANALIKEKLDEVGIMDKVKMIDVERNKVLQIGDFKITFIGVTHSIPNSFSIFVETPSGSVFFSGDYKIDQAPANEPETDYNALNNIKGRVDLALMESTNAFEEGKSITAMQVEQNIEDIIKNWKGRIILASFSSLVSRIYSFMQIAKRVGRKINLSGRSMSTTLRIARELRYIDIPEDLLIPDSQITAYPDEKMMFVVTGSQGERYAALNRISRGEHKFIKAKAGDLIMLSSSEIPSNVVDIQHMTDRLIQVGAEVINGNMADIHETGHGMQEDMKMMYDMVKPKNVIPIHGFLTLRYQNKKNFIKWGMPANKVHLTEDGQTWVLSGPNGEVKKGPKIESKPILIDALGYADSGDVVIKDRQKLAEFGVLCVTLNLNTQTKALIGEPNFISRGFVNLSKEDKYRRGLESTVRDIHMSWYKNGSKGGKWDEGELRGQIERRLGKYIYKSIERDPIILTIFV
jgi:ribonuclease J